MAVIAAGPDGALVGYRVKCEGRKTVPFLWWVLTQEAWKVLQLEKRDTINK